MIIEVRNLSFQYPGTRSPALQDLEFNVRDGEIFGFLGPSGAGKSTTLGILTGTLVGCSGEVSVLGIDPREAGGDFYRSVGVCFESPRFHGKFTARENLKLFGDLYGSTLRSDDELFGRLALSGDADKRVEAYSKGMMTRLSLIRSMLHRPSLLFLDEPTNGLDPSLTKIVWDLIREEREKGTTIFLTTHNMATAAKLCDRVGFLVDGRLVLVDSPAELAQRYGRQEVILEYHQECGEESGARSSAAALMSATFPMEDLADNEAFLNLLRSMFLATIHSREASLDDVFRRVTGRGLS